MNAELVVLFEMLVSYELDRLAAFGVLGGAGGLPP